jgi:hypothetical protein
MVQRPSCAQRLNSTKLLRRNQPYGLRITRYRWPLGDKCDAEWPTRTEHLYRVVNGRRLLRINQLMSPSRRQTGRITTLVGGELDRQSYWRITGICGIGNVLVTVATADSVAPKSPSGPGGGAVAARSSVHVVRHSALRAAYQRTVKLGRIYGSAPFTYPTGETLSPVGMAFSPVIPYHTGETPCQTPSRNISTCTSPGSGI